MISIRPPSYKTRFIDLPLARLHILETGRGAPLIMVPATISELENWVALAQFMAQWFHVYFFELPGHGRSEPFRGGFSSQKVAQLVEELSDSLGLKRFNLMGFSFGGILAMQTFKRLSARIDRMILIAPCLGHPTLSLSAWRLSLLRGMNRLLGIPAVQRLFNRLIHNRRTISAVTRVLKAIGKLEDALALEKKLLTTPASAISVLNAQINEILTLRFDAISARYSTPCYFAMSVHDPLLHFDETVKVLGSHFENLNTVRLAYPFHQPPAAFTYQDLNRDFHGTVDDFMREVS